MAEPSVTVRPTAERRIHAVVEISATLGCAAALLSTAGSVRWAGGRDGHLLVAAGTARRVEPDADALRRALADAGVGGGEAVAIEPESLTLAVAAGLGHRRCPSLARRLATARSIKDADEIELIAQAAELVTAGHDAVRAAATPGVTELELWTAAQAAMQEAAGGPVEAGVDLMVGKRTALAGVPPAAHAAEAGDPVLFDLAPRREGYWADSCATFACGVAGPRLRRRHDAIRRALERGLAEARPGTTAARLDAAIRAELERHGLTCPHHTGHGVGAAPQEPPWLVPEDATVIDEGMVVAIEPGAYSDGFGVRLEHLAVIEAAGARILTTHDLDL